MCKGMPCKVGVEFLLIDRDAVKGNAADISKFLQVHIVAVIDLFKIFAHARLQSLRSRPVVILTTVPGTPIA